MENNLDASIRDKLIIIGISGVTCGGKTTLAHQLMAALSPARPTRLFHQDRYFFPDDSARHTRCVDLPHNNYDILSALDMEQFYSDVLATLRGEDRSHSVAGVEPGPGPAGSGGPVLILEGFTALNYKPLYDLCHLRYYFVLEYAECAARRAHRLYDPPDIAGYFDRCVWPEHLRYRDQLVRDPRVRVLDGAAPGALALVLDDVRAADGDRHA